jgi:hypothetical protein
MRPVTIALPLLLAGCMTGRLTQTQAPHTPIRVTVAETVREMLAARLEATDAWRGEIVGVSQSGQSATNPGEEWDETTLTVTFAATGNDGEPRLLTQPEMADLLRGLRSHLRRVVTQFGGENQDTSEGEAFRERWLAVPYKLGAVAGGMRATVGPASHKADETVSQLVLTVRETPTK